MSQQTKMTAVEWIVDKLLKGEFINNPDELIEQAKKLEKWQMKKIAEYWHFNGIPDEVFDDYYDEMFIWSSFPNENS